MELGIYLSAAGALAAETELDVVANNIANVDTPGFRRGTTVFQKRLMEAQEPPMYDPSRNPILDKLGGGLFVHEVAFDEQNGPHRQSTGTFDVALEGDGWLAVQRGPETMYTRAGNFVRDSRGRLVTQDGRSEVLDVRGKPIDIPEEGPVRIDPDGRIYVENEEIAQLAILGTVDRETYEPKGDNLFRYTGSGEPEATVGGRVNHRFLEYSSVNPVREMVNLIRTFRAYESNQRMITQQDQTFGRAVNDVGRTGSR